jgi:hypothetical protein
MRERRSIAGPWYSEQSLENWLFEHLDLFLDACTKKERQVKIWDCHTRDRFGDLYGHRSVVDIVAHSGEIDYLIEIKRDLITSHCVQNQMALLDRRRDPSSQMVVAAPRISEQARALALQRDIEFWQIGIGGMPVG